MTPAARPNTIPWPPIILVMAVALGMAVNWVLPARESLGSVPPGLSPVGSLIFILAIAGDIWAIVTMARARTNILPHKAADKLITHGPFAHSRNPIYLCNSLAIFGLALAINNAWLIYAAIGFAIAARLLAIAPEEKHLAAKFGDEWHAYKARVPRWILFW